MGLNTQLRTATVGSSAYYVMAGSTTPAYSTTPCVMQFFVDITAVAAGDEFKAKLHKKIDGTNVVVVYEANFVPMTNKGWSSPMFIVDASGWDWSCEKVGGTDRSLDMRVEYVT